MKNRVLANALSVIIIVALASGYFWISEVSTDLAYWIIFFLILIFFGVVGKIIKNKILGILIDQRNKISLSRMQLVAWTLIVLAGFYAMGLLNLQDLGSAAAGSPGPLDIAIPQEVWWLLGISTTSLVGSPLLQNFRSQQSSANTPAPDTSAAPAAPAASDSSSTTAATTDSQTTPVQTSSVIHKNDTDDKASFWDIFKGEEGSNYQYVDVSKVQMLFFTVIIMLAYVVALVVQLREPGGTYAFPELNAGLVALLGISHAGYLTNKVIPKS